jgi:hypothetical protein
MNKSKKKFRFECLILHTSLLAPLEKQMSLVLKKAIIRVECCHESPIFWPI